MSSLLRLQSHFASAVLRGDDRAVAAMVVGDGIASERRLAIHRNHLRITLTEALAATFPALRSVVGVEAFEPAATAFVRWMPPTSPCLHEYGGEFPGFLAGLRPGRPFLGDLGRLEWAINRAFHAPEKPALVPERLADIAGDDADDLVFSLQPSLGLIRSPFPIDDLWEAAEADALGPSRRPVDGSGVDLAVLRRGTSVKWWRLAGWEWDLLAGLAARRPFGAVVREFSDRDVSSFLAGLLGTGLLTGAERPDPMKGPSHVADDRHRPAAL